jgi:2-dehydropantoate 2-reductase
VKKELAEHGLAVSDNQGFSVKFEPDRIEAGTKPVMLRKADIILLTVKGTGTEQAAKEIARSAKGGATVISLQNGVSNPATLRRLLPRQNVIQAMVPYNVVRLGPGRWHRATWGDLVAEDQEVTRDLSARIGDRPGRLLLAKDMQAVAWGKLLLNLNNAINALSGTTYLAELKQRDFRRVFAAAMVETLALLKKAGIRPAKIGKFGPELLPHVVGAPDWVFNKLFLKVQKIDPKGRGSMADDFDAGRPTEIDFLNGEVVRLAESLGEKAPVNSAIVDLVKQAELGVQRTWGAKQLCDHILGGHKKVKGFGY